MSPLLAVYIVGVAVTLIAGIVYLAAEACMIGYYGYDADMRKPTRLILLSPFWPIAAIYGLYRLTVWAFDLNKPKPTQRGL